MKWLSIHEIASRRRQHTFRRAERRSPIALACAEEMALIVEHHHSVSVSAQSR